MTKTYECPEPQLIFIDDIVVCPSCNARHEEQLFYQNEGGPLEEYPYIVWCPTNNRKLYVKYKMVIAG